MSTISGVSTPSKALHIALWVGQLLLAAMFLMAGSTKLFDGAQFPYPTALTTFIGVAEVSGAIGVILPALTRIKPFLTPLAAAGLATVMILATATHLSKGEPFGMTTGLGLIALFVAWGRSRKAPIRAR